MALDYKSNSLKKVEPVMLIIAGISCTDASRLSCHNVARRGSVSEGAHSTGSTFLGLMNLVQKMDPPPQKLLMENVPSLMDKPNADSAMSNFQAVTSRCHAMNYNMVHAIFDSVQLGLPVTRERLYMLASLGKGSGSGCCEERARQHVKMVIQSIAENCKKYELGDFLLPEYTEMFQDWNVNKKGDFKRKRKQHDEDEQQHTQEEWPSLHEGMWVACAHNEDRSTWLSVLSDNDWFNCLSPRRQDALLLQLCSEKWPGPVDCIYNLEMSAPRISRRSEEVQCLVPRGVYWLKARSRTLLGLEALLLQGADLADLPTLRPGVWDNNFLQNLAGNAFNTFQFMSWFVASMSCHGG